jgi:hypothetical protein
LRDAFRRVGNKGRIFAKARSRSRCDAPPVAGQLDAVGVGDGVLVRRALERCSWQSVTPVIFIFSVVAFDEDGLSA